MKAAVLEGVDEIHLREVDSPECTDDTVLIRVDACAVCGTDVKALRHGHSMMDLPVILGHELAGTIVQVGQEVRGYYDSERVTVAPAVPCGSCLYCRRGHSTVCQNILDIGSTWDGGFADYLLVPPAAVRNGSINKLPDGLSSEAAALTEPLACCLNAQERLEVGPGDRVLVIGCGPIGCLNAMLARALGARAVYMADISAERLRLAEAADADGYFNSDESDLRADIMGVTEDRGADVVIVACGSAAAQEQAVPLVAPRGRLNYFGGLPRGSGAISFDSNRVHYEELTLVGNHGSTPLQNHKALSLIASGRVDTKKVITHVFPLDQIEDALETAEAKEGLKVLVKPHE
jgi:L-iditol 2-dehydrogenase